jgi:dCTP deaminase
MDTSPWRQWVPGALAKSQVMLLHRLGLITLEGAGNLGIGACSIDLSVADRGFLMKRGSIKPSTGDSYDSILKDEDLAKRLTPLEDGSFLLKRKETYVFELRERLHQRLNEAEIHGQATAKSSIGRMDVLARLIVDRMDTYESFDPRRLSKSSGQMYIEITPNTFDVRVKRGTDLTQLRLFYGNPAHSQVSGPEILKTVLGSESGEPILTLDLEPEEIRGIKVSAFRAKVLDRGQSSIPLWQKGSQDPCQYWKFVTADKKKRLQILKDQFYILRSKERMFVPKGIAIYCKASDETIGEMRIHYAGFVHPGFGMNRTDHLRGTQLTFEVRGHQVDANLIDGEKMANIIFYRMSRSFAEMNKSYNDQKLKLSNIFQDWPERLKIDHEGNVEPR